MTTRLSRLSGAALLCVSLLVAPSLHAQSMIQRHSFTAGGGGATGSGHRLFSTIGAPAVGESGRLRSGTLWPHSFTPIPVEMASFDAAVQEGNVLLRWTTASETNNAGFHVERRDDGSWIRVGFVEGAGTTGDARSYRYVDADLPFAASEVAYRLQQVDLDGTSSLSDVVRVDVPRPASVALHPTFPNPARTSVTVRYELPASNGARPVRIELYNLLGQQIRTVVAEDQPSGRYEQRLDVSGLASGPYYVRLVAGSTVQTRRLTVVR